MTTQYDDSWTGAAVPDATRRFSRRADLYNRYRPGYPAAVLALLKRACGLGPRAIAADIGSGTGLLTALLLQAGATVYAIEPNAAMRAAAARTLGGRPGYRSRIGTAETTGLPAAHVDLITAGQAFHWFDYRRARAEFRRVLRPGGWVALVWNWRRTRCSPFLQDYEALLLDYATEYPRLGVEHGDERRIATFFAPGKCRQACFPNEQRLDWSALRGLLLSASYAPDAGDPRQAPLLAELERIFARHQQHGLVRMEYDTRVFYGQMTPPRPAGAKVVARDHAR